MRKLFLSIWLAIALFACGYSGPVGDVYGVDTPSAGGLVGGAPSGVPSLSLKACSTDEILKYNGSAWACASDAGVTGSGTSGYLTKWTDSDTIGNSALFDTGSQLQIAEQTVVYSGGGTFGFATDNGYSNLTNNGYSGILGSNYGTYNTTSGAITNSGVKGYSVATRSAGSNPLTNVGVWGEASGAQNNYSFWGQAGELHNEGNATIGGTLTVTGAFTFGQEVATQQTYSGATGTDMTINSGTTTLIISPSSAFNLSGFTGGVAGRRLRVVFIGSAFDVTIVNDATSTAANRILTGTATNWTMASGRTMDLEYEAGSVNRWRIVSAYTTQVPSWTVNGAATFFGSTTIGTNTSSTHTFHGNIRNNGTLQVNTIGSTAPTFEGGSGASIVAAQASGNWGIAVIRATADGNGSHITIAKTRATDPSTKTALVNGDVIGDLTWQGVDGTGTMVRGAAILGSVDGTVTGSTMPTGLGLYTGTGSPVLRLYLPSDGGVQIADSSTASVSAATSAKLRYNSGALQLSLNTGAYSNLVTVATLASSVTMGAWTTTTQTESGTSLNDLALNATTTTLYLTGTNPTLTGMTGGVDGRRILICHINGSTSIAAIAHESGSSATAANRFYTSNGVAPRLQNGSCSDAVWSSVNSRWTTDDDTTMTSLATTGAITVGTTLGVTNLATFSAGFVSNAASTIATTNTLGANGLAIDRTTTPTQSEILLRVNSTTAGAMSLTPIAQDNHSIAFDAEYLSSTWTARDDSAFRIYKDSGALRFQKTSGTTNGSTISWTDIGRFDSSDGKFWTNGAATIGGLLTASSLSVATTATISGTTTVADLVTTLQTSALSTGDNSITLNATTSRLHLTYNGGSTANIKTITAGAANRVLWLTYAVTCNDCDSYLAVTTGGNLVGWESVGGGPVPISGNGVGMLKLISDGTYWYVDMPRATTNFRANFLTAGYFVNGQGLNVFSAGEDNAGDGTGAVSIGTNAGTTNVTFTNVRGYNASLLRKTTLVTATDTTFDLQTGTRKIRIRAVGGGGGGGGADGVTSNRGAGGGGGAGQYGECQIGFGDGWDSVRNTSGGTVNTISITIGTAGSAGTGTPQSTQVGSGGNTVVTYALDGGSTRTLTFHGGNGGYNAFPVTGTAFSASAYGFTDMTTIGAPGDAYNGQCYVTSGDNGSMGVSGNGSMYPGQGGSSPLGMGGYGVWNGVGAAGSGYGAGGGGGSSDTSTDRNGGNGTAGAVIVEEYF